MGLSSEIFQAIIWILVIEAVFILFDPTGRIAKILLAFTFVALVAGALTWWILHVAG